MRVHTLLISAMLVAAPAAALAQNASATSSASKGAIAAYSTSTTDIGTLLDDPAAKAVLDKHIPGFTSNEQVDMARGMTLKDVQQYAPDQVTDKVLTEVDADLAKLPAKK